MDNTPPRTPRQTTAAGGALRQRKLPGVEYSVAEFGAGGGQSPNDVLSSLALAGSGQIYDLDAGRWSGMPILRVHPPFSITTYRTPRGTEAARRSSDGSAPQTGFTTELIISSAHTGTHIDALAHVSRDGQWYAGGSDAEHLGDFGPTRAEASAIPPFIRRGVLIDIAGLRDVSALPAGTQIGWEEIGAALVRQRTKLVRGDAVLIRTGYMSVWGEPDGRQEAHYGAGINLEAAAGLADAGAVVIGSDTEDLECVPAADRSEVLPVHVELMTRRGIHIMELLYLEQLAAGGAYEFLFICLPLRVRGATGSMVRPIAIT